MMMVGSHFGYWDLEDDMMRAVLATPHYGLSCAFAAARIGFSSMALGETLGYSARLAQNNLAAGLYRNQVDQGAGQVHVTLWGILPSNAPGRPARRVDRLCRRDRRPFAMDALVRAGAGLPMSIAQAIRRGLSSG